MAFAMWPLPPPIPKNLPSAVDRLALANTLVRQGARYVVSGVRRKLVGHRRYGGDPIRICQTIVDDLFDRNRGYYLTSLSTYREFWARDFGRCAPALVDIGQGDRVAATYRRTLEIFARHGRFALTITPDGRLLDFPGYAPDGLAFYLNGLAYLDDPSITAPHEEFLEKELERFKRLVVDPETGLVRKNVHFSEAQDYAVRSSSCYSNCMCFLLGRSLERLGFSNPLEAYDYRSLITESFLEVDHFRDDLSGNENITGDSSLMPFWCGVVETDVDGRGLLDRVLSRLEAEGLNSPFPTRYGAGKDDRKMILIEKINPWQRDAVWTCLGLHFLEILEAFEHPRYARELEGYARLVDQFGCFPEVIDARTGGLFDGPLYRSEDSMLWASNLLRMLLAG